MKLIYVMDEYGPHGPIPNSVAMSHGEYISHYSNIPLDKGMTYFHTPAIHRSLKIDHMYVHHSDVVNNIDYYAEQGTIMYIINIHHNIQYISHLHFGTNRGAWTEYIPANIVKLWEKGKCKIVIAHNWADCETWVVNNIFEAFNKKFQTCRDFYVWTTSLYSPETLKELNVKYQKNFIHLPFAEMWSLKNLPPYQANKREKDKKFIKLARRYTLDRLASHVTFTKENLNQCGFVSMPETCPSTKLPLVEYIKQVHKDEVWAQSIDDINLQGATLDQASLSDSSRNSSYSGSWMGFREKENLAEYYDRSYFSIVSESRFNIGDPKVGFFYTEKIMRTMLYEHPFLLQAVPYALEHLKLAGYKTFDKFWDEDYDKITNHTDRVLRITEIVKDICHNKDLDSLSKEWTEIIEHNKNHVYNRVADFKNYLEGLKNEKSISDGT